MIKRMLTLLLVMSSLSLSALAQTDFSLYQRENTATNNRYFTTHEKQSKEKPFIIERPLNYKNVEVLYSVSKHINFRHPDLYNYKHPEIRVNLEGFSVGVYKNSLYYWSPYVGLELGRMNDVSLNAMVAWYGPKVVPVLMWGYDIGRFEGLDVGIFAITHPLLESDKVVAGLKVSKRF